MEQDEQIGLIGFKGQKRKDKGLIPSSYCYGCMFLERVFDYQITSLCDDQERTIIHYLNNKKVMSSGKFVLRHKIDGKGGLVDKVYKDREQEQNKKTMQLLEKYQPMCLGKVKLEVKKSFKYWTINCFKLLPSTQNLIDKRQRWGVFYDKEVNRGKGKSTITITSQNQDWEKYNQFVKEKFELNDIVFEYNTITINCNVKSKPHLDERNVGLSYIIAIGDYLGGDLCIYDDEKDEVQRVCIKDKFHCFNGSEQIHWTSPFQGQRTSIIIYNIAQ